jgi:transcription elongation factor Elf1
LRPIPAFGKRRQSRFRPKIDPALTESQVSFVCNCGEEILMEVKPDEEYNVVCSKCGQEYRFFGQSVLRWKSE